MCFEDHGFLPSDCLRSRKDFNFSRSVCPFPRSLVVMCFCI
jgi:hypothetical protein